jgi:hypothetical protein
LIASNFSALMDAKTENRVVTLVRWEPDGCDCTKYD